MAAKQPSPVSPLSPTGRSGETSRYSREYLLSLYRECPLPSNLDASLQIVCSESFVPIGNSPLNEIEKPIWESGVLNSETKQRPHQKRGDYKARGKGRMNYGQQGNLHHHSNNNQQQEMTESGGDTNSTWTQVGDKRQFGKPSFAPIKHVISPRNHDNMNMEEAPLPEDIWDVPQKGDTKGSFANGAFFSGGPRVPSANVIPTNVSGVVAAPLVDEKQLDWKNVTGRNSPIEPLTQSLATLGQGSLGRSWESSGAPISAYKSPIISQQPQAQNTFVEVPRGPLVRQPVLPPQPPVVVDPIWYYKDPQGNVQGPFAGAEMQQWFEAGYFPDNLLVKFATDDHFEELVAYVSSRMQGQVNFLNIPQKKSLSRQSSFASNPVTSGFPVARVEPKQNWSNSPPPSQQQPPQPHQQPVKASWNPELESKEEKMNKKANETGPVWGGVKMETQTLLEIQREEELRKAEMVRQQQLQKPISRRYADTVAQGSSWAEKLVGNTSAATGHHGLLHAGLSKSRASETGSMSSSMESLYTAPSTPHGGRSATETPEPVRDETLKWLREQMKPLQGRIDLTSFIEILTPLDDPYTITEIIHDAIGINYKSVDPRKLSAEFIKKRYKQGRIKGDLIIPAPPPHSAYAMAQKSNGNSSSNEDKGFVQVVSKKKKNKKPQQNNGSEGSARIPGAPVGIGGKPVVGLLPK